MPLEPLDSSPAAFVPQAEKINQLVKLLNSMTGRGGVDVKVSEANIIISITGVPGLDPSVTLREIDICVSGVAMKMKVYATAPY